ncbi:hypothetical protein KY345_01765 [Candidatus Woesearchaeota archaeon]|nr:hypothetical protein [Candidatus Woesearchaeota archaeon]
MPEYDGQSASERTYDLVQQANSEMPYNIQVSNALKQAKKRLDPKKVIEDIETVPELDAIRN